MGDFAKMQVMRPRRPAALGAGSVWRTFRAPTVFAHKAAPTCIEFSPVAPHDFAVASSLQVDLYSTQTNSVFRTLTRFKDVARSCTFRHDGKMIAAGDDQGKAMLYDVSSRSVMRTFHGHSRAVRVCKFSGDGAQLMTASDDGRGLCWDVAAEKQVCALEGHTDFVRAGALSPASPHLFATGSYDHTVRLWDVSAGGKAVMTLKHAAPVEDLVLLPGGGMLATASGNVVTVWDLLSGGRVLHAVNAHSKTITGLATDAGAAHILSASLDRTVKVYELGSGCKVVGAIKYDDPLLSVGLSPLGSHLVVGTTDNSVIVRRQRLQASTAEPAVTDYRERDPLALASVGLPGQVARTQVGGGGPRPGTYRYFLRGRRHAAQPADVVAEGAGGGVRLTAIDKALKRFQYHEALDAALRDGGAEVVVSVVEELVQRNGLRIALQGRDQQTLQPVVGFLARQIVHPPFAPTLIGMANLLLDMYAPVLGQSAAIDELFVKLRNTIEAEMRLQAELAQLLGAMDVLLAGAVNRAAAAPPPRKLRKVSEAPAAEE